MEIEGGHTFSGKKRDLRINYALKIHVFYR